jgi:hypothetical protein
LSRTYRSDYVYSHITFKHSHKQAAVQSCLYKSPTQVPNETEDYLELTYKDRTRHRCLSFPYYTSSWRNVCPGCYHDRWAVKVKPAYCTKKLSSLKPSSTQIVYSR